VQTKGEKRRGHAAVSGVELGTSDPAQLVGGLEPTIAFGLDRGTMGARQSTSSPPGRRVRFFLLGGHRNAAIKTSVVPTISFGYPQIACDTSSPPIVADSMQPKFRPFSVQSPARYRFAKPEPAAVRRYFVEPGTEST